jgi:polysaccharide biosynthesis transport protein
VRRTASHAVATHLGLRELGQVPANPGAPDQAYRLPALEDPAGAAAAAYRDAADAVGAHEWKALAVCGTVAGDRAEHVAAGLAVALAAEDRKAVVVELDPERPALRRLFALPRRPGLAEIAREEAALHDGLAPVPGVPGLEVLGAGAGRLPPGEAAGRVLEALRERFDRVVMAGPPLLGPDGGTPAGADAVVLVVALERIRHSRRPRLERLMRGLRAPVVGYVLVAPAGSADGAHHLAHRRRQAGHGDGEQQQEQRVVR